MATPIGYTKQFIPTNVGLISQQLGQRQQRHDQALSNLAAAEDQYGQMLVDPSDIESKNAILGDFANRTKNILDKYNGDYGAASKELTREISKTRKDPFFQLAPYKRALAEEERRRVAQLGPNAIVTKSVSNTPIYDPNTGLYATKEDLQSEILDRRDIEKAFMTEYGGLAKEVQDEVIPGRFAGYHTSRRHRGIRQEEVPQVASNAAEYLKSLHPRISDEVAQDIALNMSSQLVGGFTDQDIADRGYVDPSKGGQEQAPTDQRLPYFTEGSIKKESTGGSDELQSDYDEATSLTNSLASNKNVDVVDEAQRTGRTPEEVENDLAILNKNANAEYNKIVGKYKNHPTFKYLKETEGLSDLEAMKISIDEQKRVEEAGVFGNVFYPTDISDLKGKILRSVSGTQSSQFDAFEEDDKGVSKAKKPGWFFKDMTVSDVVGKYGENIYDAGFDYDSEHVVLKANDDGEQRTFRIPFDAIGNTGVNKSLKRFSSFVKAYTKTETPGIHVLGDENNPSYILNVEYDKKNKRFTKDVYKVERDRDGNMYRRPVPVQEAMASASSDLFDYYGEQPEYIQSKGTRTRTNK